MSVAPLTLAAIDTGGSWRRLEDAVDVPGEYRDLTGVAEGVPAGGLPVVWARRGFSRGRPLPAGGVLLAIDQETFADHSEDIVPEYRVDVDTRRRAQQRPVVSIRTSLRQDGRTEFARVTFVLLWPELLP